MLIFQYDFLLLNINKIFFKFEYFQILECGGNLYDTIAACVKAALYSTEIPKVKGALLDGGEADIILSDDIYECVRLDVKDFPLIITLCKVSF